MQLKLPIPLSGDGLCLTQSLGKMLREKQDPSVEQGLRVFIRLVKCIFNILMSFGLQ
jgi:hypothetical protein